MPRIFYTISLLLIISALSGCTSLSTYTDPVSTDTLTGLEDFREFKSRKMALLSKYYGENKETIIADFGEPHAVRTGLSYNREGVRYEEKWNYKYSKYIPFVMSGGYIILFYFYDDEVTMIDIL